MSKSTSTTPLIQTKIILDRIGYSDIFTLQEDPSAFFYKAGMTIDADGAYKAYHPKNTGLDSLSAAGHPGNWWALVTDVNGNPVVQNAGDPAPGYYISTTSLENTKLLKTNPKRYVDSESIPYIVLPGRRTFGAGLGDFCIVYNTANQKVYGGIYADSGPRDHIGEASIAMANALSIPSSPRNGGISAGVVYLVFPKTKTSWPLSITDIQSKSLSLFNTWGGLNKLKSLIIQ